MRLLFRLLISTLAVFAAQYIVGGVSVDHFTTAIAVAIVLGLLNTLLKPVLVVLTIPVTVLTLGLFLLVINAIIVLITAALIGGFHVTGFWPALVFSIVISLITWMLESIAGSQKKD